MKVRIAAILTISDERQRTEDIPVAASQLNATAINSPGSIYLCSEILGENLLDRTLHRLEQITSIPSIVLTSPSPANSWFRTSRSLADRTWETAVSQQLERGAEVLLFASLNAYTDLDYQHLLEFHLQTRSPFTRVYSGDAWLDLALLNVSALASDSAMHGKPLSTPIPGERQYLYRGYVNRLRRPQDYYKLVEDGLAGRCGLKPRGDQVAPGVWYGAGAKVDGSATILAPAFIGADAQIAAGSVIDTASIEKNCEVDCGTAVTNSWVLENTYVGLALEVRRAVVGQQKLFHLDRDLELNISDGGLLGVTSRTMPFFAQLESFFLGASDHAGV
jgi:hypothetical protein